MFCVWGEAMYSQLRTCSLPVLTSNSGKQYLLRWLLIILDYWEGKRKREENTNIVAFDARESLDPLSASLGRGHLTAGHQSRITGWGRGSGVVEAREITCAPAKG